MNNFLVITNTEKDPDFRTTLLIKKYLENRGKKCPLYTEVEDGPSKGYTYTSPNAVPKDTQCIIVLGGDGTLIQAARDLGSLGIPFIGVNFGKLGYMAEVEKEQIIPTLDLLINDKYSLENRMMLYGDVTRDGKVIAKNIALNDIVINRSGSLRIIDFYISVNDKLLNHYAADGVIISTPTGSTAYNMSAGGPIVEPSAELILLTPICPHTLNTRSIVLSSKDIVSIEIGNERNIDDKKIVGFDGYDTVELLCKDVITIRKCDVTTQIIKITDMSFLEILQKKMEAI